MLLHKFLSIEIWEADQPPQEHYKQNPHFEILEKKNKYHSYYSVNIIPGKKVQVIKILQNTSKES